MTSRLKLNFFGEKGRPELNPEDANIGKCLFVQHLFSAADTSRRLFAELMLADVYVVYI